MSQYIDDATRLSQPMGNFMKHGLCLFYWSGPFLGWRYLKDINP